MTETQAPTRAAPGAAREPSDAYKRAQKFVSRVHDLCGDPGRRAALRSGLGRPLDRCSRMHAVIAGFVPERLSESSQRAHYSVAAMIASLPPAARRSATAEPAEHADAPQRNFGRCLADAVESGRVRESAAEARLSLLTRQSVSGLHRHVPSSVRLLTSRPDDVDFAQLLVDLTYWDRYPRRIGRTWLQSYYRSRMRADQQAAEEADAQLHQGHADEDH
ncbi:type I-E CRISPR-associated protein Cse2/CasB [Streptomyces albidus (ex Kaewkla and Franco 2022)]|uniref:type I-E CRISPR-associated protein Cse2/CasB n=1 Tax=Streptomyces albidus (ex Kaewkla and Franco 2022) TaxID=722709 RepID=UPI0015EE6273|nr:type I-E CRISPR-associated protein Cse2/CasB [Streptomyces albidus (ex Kaewkla and Franco 2022)]